MIVNSSVSRIYRYDIDDKCLELLCENSNPNAKLKVNDLMAHEAGRYQKSSSPNQGNYEPHTDPKTVESEKFSIELASELEKINEHIDHFIIIAPSHFQGILKRKLKKSVLESIDDFFDKNYINLTMKELEKHLSDLLGLKF
jgi:protein required for attachment to host cells